MAREIRKDIEINASPERVWSILSDFGSYAQWNPFIRQASGEAKEGARLALTFQAGEQKPMSFKPKVLKAASGKELRWLGRLGMPGIFDGEHSFSIEPLPGGGVKFVQREQFRGILVPFMWKSLQRDAGRGFSELNEALKQRAESSP